jgi:deazaflavin-dependent oxidoreductase (nitroreductase family)
MSIGPAPFDAGRPGLSGPLRRIARRLGPLALPLAGTRWLPLYAVLEHTGRTTGRFYRTPVVGLAIQDGFLIPLPFGSETQWARNLFAAGDGSLRKAGLDHPIGHPLVVERATVERELPALVRQLSRLFGLRQFVRVRDLAD